MGWVIWLMILPPAAGAAPAPAAPPGTADPAGDAVALVRLLGDRSFKVRERATRQLTELGTAAEPALRAGCRDPDPEVRRRCAAILPRARRFQVKLELRALLADRDGKPDHDLPGWRRFRRLVGRDEVARRLYMDMMRSDEDVLRAADSAPARAGAPLDGRCRAVAKDLLEGRTPALGTVAAHLFTATDRRVRQEPSTEWLLLHLLQDPLPDLLTVGPTSDCVRKLALLYLRRETDPRWAHDVLRAAIHLKLKGAVGIAREQIRHARPGTIDLSLAVYAVGRLGSAEDVALLEPLLNDDSLVGSFSLPAKVLGRTGVRDVALASLVRLTGQALADYGFPAAQLTDHELDLDGGGMLGFYSAADRARALRRWKAWAARHRKPRW